MFNFYIDKLTFLRKLRKDSYICELCAMVKDDSLTRNENPKHTNTALLMKLQNG